MGAPKFSRMGIKVPPTASELEAQKAVTETLVRGAYANGAQFTKPDDDWVPIWMVLTDKQGTMMMPESMVGPEEKRGMTNAVAAYARRVGATAIGSVQSSWRIRPDAVSQQRMLEILAVVDAHYGSTEGIPEREEAVVITVFTATTYRVLEAKLDRHEGAPPTLGLFEETSSSDMPAHQLEGRMVDPLRAALRKYG